MSFKFVAQVNMGKTVHTTALLIVSTSHVMLGVEAVTWGVLQDTRGGPQIGVVKSLYYRLRKINETLNTLRSIVNTSRGIVNSL